MIICLPQFSYILHPFKGPLVFRITKFYIKKTSDPLKTVYSNITIDDLLSFK